MRVDRRWIGRFTVLLSLGGFYASNAFTQTLAFDVADVKSFPSCAVADAAPSFAPALQVNSPPPHATPPPFPTVAPTRRPTGLCVIQYARCAMIEQAKVTSFLRTK
jgi:hypothetical protein